MSVQPLQAVRDTCLGQVESGRVPLRPPTPRAAQAPGDQLRVQNKRQAAVDLNFANFLRGFQSGDPLKVDNGFLNPVGGNGRIHHLSPDSLQAQLTVTLFGNPMANLTLHLVREGDQYRMKQPEQWNLDVSQAGNTVTLRNKANPRQMIRITSLKPGEMKVETQGLGQDATLTIKKA